MADEIRKTIILQLNRGGDQFQSKRGEKRTTQATAYPAAMSGRLTVNVSTEAALTFPAVIAANYGEVILENKDVDPAKYITFGPEVTGAIVPALRIHGGKQASFQLIPSTVYRVLASAGTQELQVDIVAK